jgi:CheY-like chemotaxis protein
MTASSATVLVVDDDEDVLYLLQLILQGEGYCVQAARDGHEALAVLARVDPPGLVLLDLMMPGIDGLVVLQSIRQRPELRGTRVVVMSGQTLAGAEALSRGADRVLSKPIEMDELLRVVASELAAIVVDGDRPAHS